MTLKELAVAIGAEVVGDGSIEIESVNTLDAAGPGEISFLANVRYNKQLETTGASAVIVAPNVRAGGIALLRHKNPYYAFSQAVVKLHGYRKQHQSGIHPRANIDPVATIGENTIVYPGVYVGPRTKIGRDCILYPNVVIYEDCIIGDRVIIHANASIGQDGYGFAPAKNAGGEVIHHKIPQIGNVVIEDDVEIGANATVDRAALGSTIIGKGSKLGDLVTVGHNARLGPGCLLVPQVGISGSTTLGHHVTMGGQSAVAGHLKIGNGVSIAGQAGVIEDAEDNTILIGAPAMPGSQARRVYAIFRNLPELVARVKKLEEGGSASAEAEPTAEA